MSTYSSALREMLRIKHCLHLRKEQTQSANVLKHSTTDYITQHKVQVSCINQ